jgi:hypothetical protein
MNLYLINCIGNAKINIERKWRQRSQACREGRGDRTFKEGTGITAGGDWSCRRRRQELQRAETGIADGGDRIPMGGNRNCSGRRQELQRAKTGVAAG